MIKCANSECGILIDKELERCPYCGTVNQEAFSENRPVRNKTVIVDLEEERKSPAIKEENIQKNTEVIIRPIVGWLVIEEGGGKGRSSELKKGINSIGRGDSNDIIIDYGDHKIADMRHFVIIFEPSKNRFLLQNGSNNTEVFLNGEQVLYYEDLKDRDSIKIGSTSLKFVSFCDENFIWDFDNNIERV